MQKILQVESDDLQAGPRYVGKPEEGTRVRVSGTPTFFIKDRLPVSTQPLETVVRVIEDELARAP